MNTEKQKAIEPKELFRNGFERRWRNAWFIKDFGDLEIHVNYIDGRTALGSENQSVYLEIEKKCISIDDLENIIRSLTKTNHSKQLKN